MSGGSFEYLYMRDPGEVMNGYEGELASMREALVEAGCEDAALATEQARLVLRHAYIQYEAARQALEGVWHAMEWWKSCDYGENQFREAVDKWRGHAD